MQTVVGVRFKKAGKIYYFNPGRLEVTAGDAVIVETSRGVEYGKVVLGPREVEDSAAPSPVKLIQRIATEADTARVAENKQKEQEAFAICEKKIAEHALSMKLVDVEYTFDVNKIVFYFTADGRIDFRELVKDLASCFRTRIELRQIGVRDEAKLMGGLGGCGRPLCCATFLGDFEPVSIRMAKEQNLSLNPTKISGICGRLMCCLKYENDCYCERFPKKEKAKPPVQGSRVMTVEGEGKVISLNMQRRSVTILLDDSKTIVTSWEDIVEQEYDGAPSPEHTSAAEAPAEKTPAAAHSERRERSERKSRHTSRRNPQEGSPQVEGETAGKNHRREFSRNTENKDHRSRGERKHRAPHGDSHRNEQSNKHREHNREHRDRKDTAGRKNQRQNTRPEPSGDGK